MEKSGISIVIVPIVNFSFNAERITLTNALVIRRIPPSELDNLMKHTPEYYRSLKYSIGEAKFVIEKRIDTSKEERYWTSAISDDTERITLALRLLGLAPFRMPIAFCLTADSLYFENFLPERIFPEVKNQPFSKKQILEFKAMWKALQKSKTRKPYLIFALSKFASSFDHSNEDRFIDYVTAFESIAFGRAGNAPSPYGRAIGIAIGMLIGKDESERTTIEKKLNEAYETRNRIVHGHLRHKLGNAENKRTSDLLDYTEKCLLRSIQKLLRE